MIFIPEPTCVFDIGGEQVWAAAAAITAITPSFGVKGNLHFTCSSRNKGRCVGDDGSSEGDCSSLPLCSPTSCCRSRNIPSAKSFPRLRLTQTHACCYAMSFLSPFCSFLSVPRSRIIFLGNLQDTPATGGRFAYMHACGMLNVCVCVCVCVRVCVCVHVRVFAHTHAYIHNQIRTYEKLEEQSNALLHKYKTQNSQLLLASTFAEKSSVSIEY